MLRGDDDGVCVWGGGVIINSSVLSPGPVPLFCSSRCLHHPRGTPYETGTCLQAAIQWSMRLKIVALPKRSNVEADVMEDAIEDTRHMRISWTAPPTPDSQQTLTMSGNRICGNTTSLAYTLLTFPNRKSGH